MRIKVLVDDVAPEGVRPVHGFAALVESEDGTILFDTGPDGTLVLEALYQVDISVADLDLLVISHHHRDHSGGAARILYERSRLEVSVPVGSAGRIAKGLPPAAVVFGERGGRQLLPGIWTTGDLGGDVPEQALIIETPAGRSLLTGCGHPGVTKLLAAAAGPIDVLVGGLHDLSEHIRYAFELHTRCILRHGDRGDHQTLRKIAVVPHATPQQVAVAEDDFLPSVASDACRLQADRLNRTQKVVHLDHVAD